MEVDLSGLTYSLTWVIEVTVADGLATVTKEITIHPGVPLFDWGENDFAFHVPVSLDEALPIASGGTGANSAEAARGNLGLGDVATDDVVPVERGGTGASAATDARANLFAAMRPVKLWSGTWTSGSLTVAKTGGSAGCTGLGDISDYKYVAVKTNSHSTATAIVDVSSATLVFGAVGKDSGGSQAIVYAGRVTRSGNTLTLGSYKYEWQNVWVDTYGTVPINEIIGLVRNDELLTA